MSILTLLHNSIKHEKVLHFGSAAQNSPPIAVNFTSTQRLKIPKKKVSFLPSFLSAFIIRVRP